MTYQMPLPNFETPLSERQKDAARRWKRELDSCTLVELQMRVRKLNKANDDLPVASKEEAMRSLFLIRFGEKADALYRVVSL